MSHQSKPSLAVTMDNRARGTIIHAVTRKSDNAPNFSVQRLLISSMSADYELEVSLTLLIAANNSHSLTGHLHCLAG